MRKPKTIEWLYLDFDGFFASVEQQARPALRGKPVGIVPFSGTTHTCIIACSKEAKARGIKNVMNVSDAKRLCPELILQPQSPDLYRRAHNALLAEINSIIPISAVKSIDELCCKLDKKDIKNPYKTAMDIKVALAQGVGKYITCSIGFAANRHLAKIACKIDKPNGVTVWHPNQMPAPLLDLPFDDIPGIGSRMEQRLLKAGIYSIKKLMDTEPKQMRKLWRNVTGERLWYALHGYEIQASKSERNMYGHGRVLPPALRNFIDAKNCSRLLLVKAARRMRRANFNAGILYIWMGLTKGYKKGNYSWSSSHKLYAANDDQACLKALDTLWEKAKIQVPSSMKIMRIGVTLADLTPANSRQLDIFIDDDFERQKWKKVTTTVDNLNSRYGKSLITMGPWELPAGGNLGGKISFTRIPRAEDFW